MQNGVLEIDARHRSISIVKYKPNDDELLTDKLSTALLHAYIAQNAATAGWLRFLTIIRWFLASPWFYDDMHSTHC